MNEKLYIHEFIDIRGHARAAYMHHMTANWSPIAQEERNQLCYGVWGVVGSTGRWPEVVNLWEEDGFEGMAAGFAHELSHPRLQDPKLERWWAEAATYRRGGIDRLMVAAPWTPTIGELCAAGPVAAAPYAHELYRLPPGTAVDFLARLDDQARAAYHEFGWRLLGGFRTAMRHDDECLALWAVPSWSAWAAFERAASTDPPPALAAWRRTLLERAVGVERILLMDAPLSPTRLGRQPARADRDPAWEE